MAWLKYNHKFSYRVLSPEYIDLFTAEPTKDDIEEACERVTNQYDGDHYRGIDYEVVSHPPVDVLEEFADEAESKACMWRTRAENYNNLLTELRDLEKLRESLKK